MCLNINIQWVVHTSRAFNQPIPTLGRARIGGSDSASAASVGSRRGGRGRTSERWWLWASARAGGWGQAGACTSRCGRAGEMATATAVGACVHVSLSVWSGVYAWVVGDCVWTVDGASMITCWRSPGFCSPGSKVPRNHVKFLPLATHVI
jgi:hypothetical protein